MRFVWACTTMWLLALPQSCLRGQPATAQVVEWDIVAEPGVSAADMHDWAAALTQQSVGHVRVHAAQPLPAPHVEQVDRDTLLVVGVLTTRNELRLPGLAIGRHQIDKVPEWLAGQHGANGPIESPRQAQVPAAPARLAFNFSADQLVGLRQKLAVPLGETTKARPVPELMKVIRRLADMPIRMTPVAREAMREPTVIEDELQDVSLGTAAAAILRPLGLVLVPSLEHGQMELTIKKFMEAEEFWPVGWPLDRPAQDVAPRLFEFLPVDIDDVSLPEALDALQGRLRMPLLFDHNGIARRELDLAQVRVTVPPTRTYYKRALERVLYAARLRPELRLDEAGKPFLWIAPHSGAPRK